MTGNSIVRAVGLTKVYGAGSTAVRAVDGISLDIKQGELVLIMGPSGSGKTTLLSILGALLRPTSGQVFINGVETTSLSESRLPAFRAQEIGFIFQAFNLLTSLTAEENVLFPTSLVRRRSRDGHSRAAALLDRLGLVQRRRHLPRDLSGGEKQRVAIARALVNDPKLILADEPTGNLDSRTGHQVMMLLHDIARDEGRTVLIVTHDSRLEDMADRVLWLEDGRIREYQGEAEKLVRDPVCGMKVNSKSGSVSGAHLGVDYFFCSERCKERFLARPEAYVAKVPVGDS